MATLERNGKGWRYVWREGGKRRKSTTYHRKGAASAAMAAFVERQERQAWPQPGRAMPWAELIDRYLASRASTTEAHRQQTRKVLEALAQERGWISSSSPTPANTSDLLPYHGRVLRALLRHAQRLDQPIDRRVLDVRQAKPKRKPAELLTTDQLGTLLAEAWRWAPANGILAHLIARYGHRAESLIRLTCAAVVGDHLDLRVKSGDDHRHPLLAEDLDWLHALACGRAAGEPLFVSHLGRAWASGSEFAAWWGHQIAPKAAFPSGRKPGVLDLRRHAISSFFAAGVDPKSVASITGHRTVSLLLDTYARTNEARQRAALKTIITPKKHLEKT